MVANSEIFFVSVRETNDFPPIGNPTDSVPPVSAIPLLREPWLLAGHLREGKTISEGKCSDGGVPVKYVSRGHRRAKPRREAEERRFPPAGALFGASGGAKAATRRPTQAAGEPAGSSRWYNTDDTLAAAGRHLMPVTLVDFCYGWTLWLFLTWIPAFFFENYSVIGDTTGGIVGDRLLRRTQSLAVARRGVIVAGFLGALVFLIPVVLIHNLTIAVVCLSFAFFRGADRWADLVCADGHCAALRGYGQRHDELRLWGSRPDLAVKLRLPGRSNR